MTNKLISQPLNELCIEITGRCLMNCMHCSSLSSSFNQQEISLNKFKSLLKDAKLLGTQIVELSGGEPLLHSQINNIIKEAKRDYEVHLYTSGFIGEKNLSGISQSQLSSFSELGLDKIIFNLQGASSRDRKSVV